MHLGDLILTDVFYRNNAGEYALTQDNLFIENSLNKIVDDLFPYIKGLMSVLSKKIPFLTHYNLRVNYDSLVEVLSKYTRDVFGPSRLRSVVKKIAKNQDIHDDMKIFGLKMNSYDPNIHRRVAYLFYWFAVYKPFSIVKTESAYQLEIPKEKRYVIRYFNEFFTYYLIKAALFNCIMPVENCKKKNECKNKQAGLKDGDCYLEINIDGNKHIFELFLNRLHNDKMNRSSLELFLSNSFIFMQCKKAQGTCLFEKNGFYRWHTFE